MSHRDTETLRKREPRHGLVLSVLVSVSLCLCGPILARDPKAVTVDWTDGTRTVLPAPGGSLTADQAQAARTLVGEQQPVPVPPTPVPAPPEPPVPPVESGDGSRLVPAGQDPGVIRPGERVRLQRGGLYRVNLRPASRSYVGAYGTGPRPVIAGGCGVIFQAPAGQVIDSPTIEDLDVVCEQGIEGDKAFSLKRPEWVGFNVLSPLRNPVIRRCSARGFAYGFCVVHSTDVLKLRNQGGTIEDCLFADNWSATQIYHGQGIYIAAWDDLAIVRPVLLNNGYVPGRAAPPGGWSHGGYVQGGLTQWHLPEGCRRVKVTGAIAIHNAAWGAQNRSDGGEISDSFAAGNAVGFALSGPLACRAVGDVVVAGHVAKTNVSFGAGGIDWRCASGELRDTLVTCPPECRPKNKNDQAPAYQPNASKRIGPTDAAYQGAVRITSGANNVALGWPKDTTVWGSTVPGLRTGPCPAVDWAWLDDYERRARAGTATAAEGIGRVRKAVGQ